MGWVESPPLFYTVLESARDLTQHLVDKNLDLPPHPFETDMNIQHVPLQARADVPSKLLRVYVDNFCYATTESKDGCHIPQIWHASIHGIHLFFLQLVVTGHVEGKEPISEKKCDLGNGNFTSAKEMIGFMFNGIKQTVHLPPAMVVAYIKEVHWILHQKLVPLTDLQTL
jgi:hypothetical protein